MPEFNILDNKDISQDIVVDRLIKDTLRNESYMWSKKSDINSIQYKYTLEINDTINLVFTLNIYNYHNEHSLNIFLEKNNKRKYVSVIFVKNCRLKELADSIEKTKNFYYEMAY